MVEPVLNPYTKAMLNCLSQFSPEDKNPKLDKQTAQFLANMIQGRFLQYLVTRLCEHYEIAEKELEKQLSMVLMNILSDKFFNVFREKVKARPEIVYKIAQKITTNESTSFNHSVRSDGLYRWIVKRYFKYFDFNVILQWIIANPEVEKIVFLSNVQQRVKDSNLVKALSYIVQNDKEGIAPSVFNRYIVKNRVRRLTDLVHSGDWHIEADFVRRETSRKLMWQQYMASI